MMGAYLDSQIGGVVGGSKAGSARAANQNANGNVAKRKLGANSMMKLTKVSSPSSHVGPIVTDFRDLKKQLFQNAAAQGGY